MKIINIILSFLLINVSANAQHLAEQGMDNTFYESITSRAHRVNAKVSTENASSDITSYVKENIAQVDLVQTHAISSKTGWHYTFAQVYNGIEVYNGELKAHVSHDGRLYLIQENLINTSDFGSLAKIDENIPAQIETKFNLTVNDKKQVIYVYKGAPVVAWQLTTHSDVNYQTHEYIIDKNQQVLYYKDLKRYFTTPPDSLVKAKVFLPDPLTNAEVEYGSPYLDLNDSNLAELNAQLTEVEFRTKYELNTFYLENEFLVFGNVSPPNNITVLSASPEFYYGRGDEEFEYVNTYFHLDIITRYVIGLGYPQLVKLIKVDPHAHNGSDNSSFDGKVDPPTLEYGDGGVDDGEDADVIIHEYCHSLADFAAPNTFVGSERQGMEEGLCDYFAVSYSRLYSDYNWHKVFNWDGHNQYWGGRTAQTSKIYPDDLNSDIHRNGEIFSSALMESWELIGRETMDEIFIESLFFLAKNQTMPQFAQAMIDVDEITNSGDNYSKLMLGFVHRKILDWGVNVPQVSIEKSVNISGTYEFANNVAPVTINAVNTRLTKVELTDALGKVVYSEVLNKSTTSKISPDKFTEGIYFLRVSTDEKDYTFKLMRY